MLCYVLQSWSNSLHILPSSSSEMYAASSDCACHIGNMKDDEDVDMQGVEGEVTVKTEEGIVCKEEECIDIKDEEDIYSEEEDYIDIKEEEDVGIKEEVSVQGTV